MEPVAFILPRFIVIKIMGDPTTLVYHKDDGYVGYRTGESVFSELVKIEVERATDSDKYVHLRFCHSNKYWQKTEDDNNFIVAQSNKPEEDMTKSSCTLFEPVEADGENGFYLHYAPTGQGLFQESGGQILSTGSSPSGIPFLFVNWSQLVKLPEHVAFKGPGGKYLKAYSNGSNNYSQFDSNDPNNSLSGYQVRHMPDGHVQIKSDYFDKYWRRSPNWIWADSTDTSGNNKDTLFWPIRIDANTIALRNAGNNNFCKGLTLDGKTDCLNAAASTMDNETRLVVEELVLERKIYNVRYRMEDARIFDETPYLAGTTSVVNLGDQTGSISVEVSIENTSSYTFSRSLSVTAGVTTTITAKVPLMEEASISLGLEISTVLQWDESTSTTTSASAKGTVAVPPMSRASVSYVATQGTCNVPFSYTVQDKSSTNGKITETEHDDGVFTGVNCYNFFFSVQKSEPL